MGKHRFHLLLAVVDPFVAVVVRVGIERRRYDTACFDARQQRVVDQRAMFDSVARIGTLVILEDSFVGLQNHVDGPVAVRVDSNPEPMRNGIVDGNVDLFLGHRQDAMIVRALVRRTHVHRALGRRPVGRILDCTDADHVVAETGTDARGLETFVDLAIAAGHERHPEEQFPDIAGILVGKQVVKAAVGIGRRGQSRGCHVL